MILPSENEASGWTFKERVHHFWELFSESSQRFYRAIDEGDSDVLTDDFSSLMERVLPRLAWVFGPGHRGGHALTLSGEGVVPKQFLTQFWQTLAPECEGWGFYASRKATPRERLEGMEISVGPNEKIDVGGVQVQTRADEEAEKFALNFWHPSMQSVPEADRMTIAFLLLDEALGEFGTERFLTQIAAEPLREDDANWKTMSLLDLPKFLQSAAEYYEWQFLSPLESRSLYELSGEPDTDKPRGDTIVGSTSVDRALFEFLNAGGVPEDAVLAGTGAEVCYAKFATRGLPGGDEAEARGRLETLVDETLRAQTSGVCVGGAIGTENSYLDLILFDGQRSRSIVKACLDEMNFPSGVTIEAMG